MAGQQHVRGGRGGEALLPLPYRRPGGGIGLYGWMDSGFGEVSMCGFGEVSRGYYTGRGGMLHPVSSARVPPMRILRSCPGDFQCWMQEQLLPFLQ